MNPLLRLGFRTMTIKIIEGRFVTYLVKVMSSFYKSVYNISWLAEVNKTEAN